MAIKKKTIIKDFVYVVVLTPLLYSLFVICKFIGFSENASKGLSLLFLIILAVVFFLGQRKYRIWRWEKKFERLPFEEKIKEFDGLIEEQIEQGVFTREQWEEAQLNAHMTADRKLIVNGREYSSLEEMPRDIREAYEKTAFSGMRNLQANIAFKTKIEFNDQEYESLDAMPSDVRKTYDAVLKRVRTDIESFKMRTGLGDSGLKVNSGREEIHDSCRAPKQLATEPTFSLTWLIAGLLLIGLLIVLYTTLYN